MSQLVESKKNDKKDKG